MSKEWIFSDDFKIKFSDKLFNEFMSTDNFKWTDEIVKEYGEWFKQKSDVFSSNPLYLVEQFKELKASKQQSVFKDKDWEILEIKYPDGYRTIIHHGNAPHILNWLQQREAEILSVKRLSDNSLWSVGDITTYGEIEEFKIMHQSMMFKIKGHNTRYNIDYAKKEKQILFTTHDGVAVYEGDEFWLLFTAPDGIGNSYKTKARKELLPFRSYQKTFSTEEVSKNWVLMNKLLLSVNDVFKVLGEVLAFPEVTLSEIIKLAESKLKQ